MKRRQLVKGLMTAASSFYVTSLYSKNKLLNALPSAVAGLRFNPTWESLSQYQVPDWYRNAKFGIWAHWGPQCQPEYGDWYAKGMYEQGSAQYNYHVKKYGHPSKFGFKEVIHEWKADQWNPDELVSLYKDAGAKYFVAMANHHDNFDMFPNKFQPWNSTKIGPKKDIIKGWADAARKHGLPFGVSVHASHTWTFMEGAQKADKSGPLAGVPYDGNMLPADGAGKWWQEMNPQDLYAQRHPLSEERKGDNKQWDWQDGASIPTEAYNNKFLDRTISLIDNYHPDLMYFDDTALPLWPVSNVGLKIAAYMYNDSVKRRGKVNAVITGKILTGQQRKCMVWDIERGQSNQIEPLSFQTDTCIGNWHYDQRVYNDNKYKSARTVVHMLLDIVSKNGNLLLNIPVKGNGTIDEKERAIVQEIGLWMKTNGEAIYDTRPWTVFGEGPASESFAKLNAQGFNEGKGKPYTAEDIRFTQKGNVLYASVFGWPDSENVIIKSLSGNNKITSISLLGQGQPLTFMQTNDGLKIKLNGKPSGVEAYVLKINGAIA